MTVLIATPSSGAPVLTEFTMSWYDQVPKGITGQMADWPHEHWLPACLTL